MSVYNGERYLREAIDSILNQTFKDFEFLIINDGSTDKTLEILQSYNDPRIKIHISKLTSFFKEYCAKSIWGVVKFWTDEI